MMKVCDVNMSIHKMVLKAKENVDLLLTLCSVILILIWFITKIFTIAIIGGYFALAAFIYLSFIVDDNWFGCDDERITLLKGRAANFAFTIVLLVVSSSTLTFRFIHNANPYHILSLISDLGFLSYSLVFALFRRIY